MSEPIVTISSGQLRGKRTEHGVAFLGVPYAEPAVGAARFAAAQPRQPWDGVRDATEHGPTSLQGPYPAGMDRLLPNAIDPGDDYLNVAVWTPDPGAQGLPVVVWIHGGAFVRGANSIATYDGDAFARDGVVLVGINYRLGVPGFPVLPDAPTNLGIRDQIAALEWVRDNIAAFGGDPGKVTIMGESAGGMSVATLMATPQARGLFHRAIIQSGGGVSAGAPDDLGKVTAEVARVLGVQPTAAALGAVEPDRLLQAQTEVSLAMILDPDPARWGATTITGGFGIMPVFPAIDGDLLSGAPERLIGSGSAAGIPLLIGSTTQEFNLWSIGLGMGAQITEDTLRPALARFGVPAQVVDGYAERRPGAAAADVFSAVVTDLLFTQPTLRLAQGQLDHAPVHLYEFDWRTTVQALGACHALELPFVFDTLAAAREGMAGSDAPHELATQMHAAWVRFATDGEPGWAAYDTERRPVQRFGDEIATVNDPRREDRQAWAGEPG
ncbi:carboxylesterase/lipase family protein [Calidifontibacter sp. DB0510]|uniref:Carboxylic ester hydrolase n=1 Tax=Metallococcus carri TaxID=1656884 RepID=A0A967E7Z8_9MICO|nr:carboxylesterase family protein [Metallococcus carri]NHN54692.1 carboxylesterase/lipase family protein [Metallococcus carri]NOP37037.1 carboxylesterase/lipase family protein [Calidifontibacter sp. DB2511S]